MFFLAILLVLASIVYYGFNSKKKTFNYWRKKGILQLDDQHLLYGDSKEFLTHQKQSGEVCEEMYYKFKKMGGQHGGYYVMDRPQWLLIHPSIIRLIMTKDFQHFSAHNPILSDTLLFKNMFHMDGEPWKDIRRKLSPTFTSGKMKMMFDMLLQKTQGLSALMATTTKNGESHEMKALLARFTTDVIGTCGFGIECDSLNNENSEFFQHGQELFKRFATSSSIYKTVLMMLGLIKRRNFDVSDIEEFFRQVVNKTVGYREKNKVVRKDFLHLMIQLKNKGSITDIMNEKDIFQTSGEGGLSMEEIAGQCLLFFTAGFETSSTTMSFALLELAQNQDVQTKLREEIREVLKRHDGNLTYEALQEMTYCENVMQETLRKYPPLAILTRLCTKNYKIPDTDITIEKGTMVSIPILALQNDPEYFPNPQKFMPERFNAQNKGQITEYSYMPFGEGPRQCLGLRFGVMQTKAGLATLINRFNFTLNKKCSYPPKFSPTSPILSVDGGIWLDTKEVLHIRIASDGENMISIAFLLVFAAIVYYGIKTRRKNFDYWKERGVPQLNDQHFLYGDMKEFLTNQKTNAEMHEKLYYEFKKRGFKYGGYYINTNHQWLVVSPSLIRLITTKDFLHFSTHHPKIADTLLFRNIFHMDGEPWKDIRRKLSPTFTSGKMKMMFDMLLTKTQGLAELIENATKNGESHEMKTLMARFTTDVIGTCGFGIECDSLNDEKSEFFQKGQAIFQRVSTSASLLTRLINTFTTKKRLPFNLTDIEDFFRHIVKETVDYREKNKIVRKDFLHLMIHLKNQGTISDIMTDKDVFQSNGQAGGLSMEEIVGQCLLFFTAGFETSSTTMSFALLELARNQDIQAKLRDEIRDVLKKHDGVLTYDALQEMPYCENVLQETLRKYPPLPHLPRLCTRDYNVPNSNVTIEKGTSVYIPILALQNDPEYFPNPDQFNPERFNDKNKSKIVEYTYMPFGEGPRQCLGLRFGIMQSKVGLVTLINKFNFTLNEKCSYPPKFIPRAPILTAVGGIWLDAKEVP
ncbi:uncharacterized protein [Euwallacea similis]|uniref:uncharacterized protein n=1 Tax=Euwallacea similis TaxID=1736056 RepID=UPI00344CFD8B